MSSLIDNDWFGEPDGDDLKFCVAELAEMKESLEAGLDGSLKGRIGHLSKVIEEFLEVAQAIQYEDRESVKSELVDLYAAIELTSESMFGLSVGDLRKASKAKQDLREMRKRLT